VVGAGEIGDGCGLAKLPASTEFTTPWRNPESFCILTSLLPHWRLPSPWIDLSAAEFLAALSVRSLRRAKRRAPRSALACAQRPTYPHVAANPSARRWLGPTA